MTNLLQSSPYLGYTYAYPHKSAYRPFAEPVALQDIWQHEEKSALDFYIHVPFCEMRCGFCNLFTQARPKADVVIDFLNALERQANSVQQAINPATFARFAIGGGTPTILDAYQLNRVFDIAERVMGRTVESVPSSVETSPATADWDSLAVLRQRGVSRISLGVQSFTEVETRAAARPQSLVDVAVAIERIRSLSFPLLNLDLIYGLPEQTVESWLASVRAALKFQPEELFLYPLYVRPLTGLGKSPRVWDDLRLACYRAARELLHDAGYTALSMRLFRAPHSTVADSSAYCIQADGMVGLGCGARSYSRVWHYSEPYAVEQKAVIERIADYSQRSVQQFGFAHNGFQLPLSEQRRRYLVLHLLQAYGVSLLEYHRRFGSYMLEDFPELIQLEELQLTQLVDNRLTLTVTGLERSDAIGPWLYSQSVRELMEGYEWH